ncbi:MAG TPA: hypothetical protein VIV40_09635 [Kofleriaceae bacterium]
MRLELRASWAPSIGLLVVAIMPAMLVVFAPIVGKLIGIVLVAALLALSFTLSKRKLIIDERGVTAKSAFGLRRLDWNEVDHYTYWSMDQTMAYAAGGQGALGVIIVMAIVAAVRSFRKGKGGHRRFSQGQLVLIAKDGTKLKIDNRYHDVTEALDRVFAELHPRLRAATPDFMPFALSDTELRHAKKGAIALAEIQHIGAGGTRIMIKKSGKRLAWVRAPMKGVKNVLLFVELLAERGLVIKANAEVFMPPTVIDKLRAAASRQAALPQARVVVRD